MAKSANFENGTQLFNIDLDSQGNLNFNANDVDGDGNRRLRIEDDSGRLIIGGQTDFGAIQVQAIGGGTTVDIDGSDGHITCTSLTETSDVRLKQSIAPILNALDKVTALRGVCYESMREDRSELGRDGRSQVGLIGQEVEAVCPELVATDAEGYKSLNYSRLTAVLVEAVKEQQQLIHMQASALAEAMRKIVQVERALEQISS